MIVSFLIVMMIIFELGCLFNVIIINFLCVVGDVKFLVYMVMILMWGIGFLFVYLFGIYFGFGFVGIWIFFIVDEWVWGILMYRRWCFCIWI